MMIVEGNVESTCTQPQGCVVRAYLTGEGRRRFFVELDADSPVVVGDRVKIDVDLDAVSAKIVEVMRRP